MRIDKTRLKWVRTKDGIVKSETVFAGSEIVRVIIDPTEYPFEYKIVCMDGNYVLAQGQAETIRKAKQDAKQRLKNMHARFIDEVRPKLKDKPERKSGAV